MSNKLVIVGNSAFAQIAFEYFTHDSDYEVVAFTAHASYIEETDLFGLPVVPFETVEKVFAPQSHSVFVAVTYPELNRVRARLLREARGKGYRIASYVSSKAFVWRNVVLGENCFIFENNVVQPFVRFGENIILWSGNHIGHHSSIADNCFISSHVVICGFVTVGANCFFGVNSTVSNNIHVAEDNWIGPNSLIAASTQKGEFYKAGRDHADAKRTAYDIGGLRSHDKSA